MNANNTNSANVGMESIGVSNLLVLILGQVVQSKNSMSNNNVDNNSSVTSSVDAVTAKCKTVTFTCQWNNFPEAIVIDGDKLTSQSNMKQLLEYEENDEK